MKNFFFAVAFMLMGTFTFASNETKENTIIENQVIQLTFENQEGPEAPKCYREAIDDFGNIYYIQVPCPPIIILD